MAIFRNYKHWRGGGDLAKCTLKNRIRLRSKYVILYAIFEVLAT
jgi:hypothetical protein